MPSVRAVSVVALTVGLVLNAVQSEADGRRNANPARDRALPVSPAEPSTGAGYAPAATTLDLPAPGHAKSVQVSFTSGGTKPLVHGL